MSSYAGLYKYIPAHIMTYWRISWHTNAYHDILAYIRTY